jgi:phosphate acetyltransferase
VSILNHIHQRAAANPQHIVLPEGEDPRTVVAAGMAARQRLARITILGNEDSVRAAARQVGADLGGVELIDPVRANDFDKMVSLLYEARRAKGLTLDEARNALRDPLYYGNLLVRANRAHRARRAALHRCASGLQIGVELFPDGLARSKFGSQRRDNLRRLRRGD